jgi:transcriptional regulator with XRE-family HTH domain
VYFTGRLHRETKAITRAKSLLAQIEGKRKRNERNSKNKIESFESTLKCSFLTKKVQNIFYMEIKSNFGDLIKELRIQSELPLRKVAARLDIDTSTLSKIEKGERNGNKEMVKVLANFFKYDYEEMLVTFLSDKVAYELLDELCSSKVLEVAEQKIKYIRSGRAK